MSNGKREHRNLIREVRREFKRCKAELEPQMLGRVDDEPVMANEEMRNIIVAQNVLRPCMEATLEALLPYSHLTSLELAIRLASYALSTAPLEDQDKLVAMFLQVFAESHALRTARGIVIGTEWRVGDGPPVPNMPLGPITKPKSGV